jgi:hypothetical protein
MDVEENEIEVGLERGTAHVNDLFQGLLAMQSLLNFHARVYLREQFLHHEKVVGGIIDYQYFYELPHNFLGPCNLGLARWLTNGDTIEAPIFRLFPLKYRWCRNVDSSDVSVAPFIEGFQL